MSANVASLQEALTVVERLSVDEQFDLLDIIYRRLVEQRREELIKQVHQSRRAYRLGKVKRGSVDDFMAELDA